MQHSASTRARRAIVDAAFADPVSIDPAFPPFSGQYFVDVGAYKIRLNVWLAGGAGDKGTIILSPPLGGSESMNSNILALNNAGIHVVTYRPRGVYDAENEYSFVGQLDDALHIVRWIVGNSGNGKRGAFGPTFRFDPHRIAGMGFSGAGSLVSYALAAQTPNVSACIGLTPGHIDYQSGPEHIQKMIPGFKAVKEASGGYYDYQKWLEAMAPADKARVSIISNAPKLVEKHVLYMSGVHQRLSPFEEVHKPLVAALRKAGVKDLTVLPLAGDYSVQHLRYSLARIVVEWLKDRGF